MRRFFLAFILAGAVLWACPNEAAAAPTPVTQFYFTGICTDCVGVGTGRLTVQNYTPGTAFNPDEFVDFIYTSSIFNVSPFEIKQGDLDPALGSDAFTGSIDTTPGPYTVHIFGNSGVFISSQGPSPIGEGPSPWCLAGGCTADFGPSHIWSLTAAQTVPEPATLSLVGGLVFAFGLVRRRGARQPA
jgi:hypothetical protein